MWFELLALINDIHVFFLNSWEETKHALRVWLGPGPRNWYLTSDSQITHIPVPDSLLFCPIKNRICKDSQTLSEERGKRLPWLSVTVQEKDNSWDITNWISEIRILSDCPIPSLLQLVRLGSRVHHMYVYEKETTFIHVINCNGEEEKYTFQGSIELKKI